MDRPTKQNGMTGPLHAYLAGHGTDGRGRTADEVLAFSDDELERVHDYIQWLFPLATRSGAQPNAPVLSETETEAIRTDPNAVATLHRAAERMLAFYRSTRWWLAGQDHNHLRITRIIRSLKLLLGPGAAYAFYQEILTLHGAAGSPINPRSLQFWAEAAGSSAGP